MIVSERFVYSDQVKKKKLPKYVKQLNRMNPVKGIYLVVLLQEGPNIMEALSVREFYRSLLRGNQKTIIGLAKDRDDAFECIGVIVQRSIETYGDINTDILVKEFID